MPTEDGNLTESEMGTLREWLKDRTSSTCPYCNQNSYTAGNMVRLVVQSKNNDMARLLPIFGGEKYIPLLVLSCDGCGNVRLISATAVGIVPRPKEGEPASTSKLDIIRGD